MQSDHNKRLITLGVIALSLYKNVASLIKLLPQLTRPAWAGFKTAEEGRAKICKLLWQKLKNKSNIKNI